MIRETFYVDGDERLIETKKFIRENMLSARFVRNPFKILNRWEICITYESEDINKLSLHLNQYHEIDNPPEISMWAKMRRCLQHIQELF